MIQRLLDGIFGYAKIRANIDRRRLFELARREKCGCFDVKCGENAVEFSLPLCDAKRMTAALSKVGITAEKVEYHGIPAIFSRYKRRLGIAIGLLIVAAAVTVAGRFVWQINIVGNSRVPDAKIIEMLSEEGIYVGKYIGDIDYDRAYNRILIKSDELCWISVNLRGTVASVEVREYEQPESAIPKGVCGNVIAVRDGQIENIELFDGAPAVKVGDAVREGQLLASGIIEGKNGSLRSVLARGRVYARTARNITVRVPLAAEEKRYTGNTVADVSLDIFSFCVNISSNSGISYTNYDTITEREKVSVFGLLEIPVYLCRTVYAEYETLPREYTETQAAAVASRRLEAALEEELRGAELVSKRVNGYFDSGEYLLEASLVCIENIALIQPFGTEN